MSGSESERAFQFAREINIVKTVHIILIVLASGDYL